MARGELRFYPQLNESHATPNPWQKMNVRIAAQTVSHTIGTAMREKGYVASGQFLLTMDKWFDLVNAGFQNKRFKDTRKPYETQEDERISWLTEDSIEYLDSWEKRAKERPLAGHDKRDKMLLSSATRDGLRAATLSIVAIIKCALRGGAEYVLPRRINQDPLEAYFGEQSQKGSRTNNPSVCEFTWNARTIAVVKSKQADSKGETGMKPIP